MFPMILHILGAHSYKNPWLWGSFGSHMGFDLCILIVIIIVCWFMDAFFCHYSQLSVFPPNKRLFKMIIYFKVVSFFIVLTRTMWLQNIFPSVKIGHYFHINTCSFFGSLFSYALTECKKPMEGKSIGLDPQKSF
jgi:hypothetical protein